MAVSSITCSCQIHAAGSVDLCSRIALALSPRCTWCGVMGGMPHRTSASPFGKTSARCFFKEYHKAVTELMHKRGLVHKDVSNDEGRQHKTTGLNPLSACAQSDEARKDFSEWRRLGLLFSNAHYARILHAEVGLVGVS